MAAINTPPPPTTPTAANQPAPNTLTQPPVAPIANASGGGSAGAQAQATPQGTPAPSPQPAQIPLQVVRADTALTQLAAGARLGATVQAQPQGSPSGLTQLATAFGAVSVRGLPPTLVPGDTVNLTVQRGGPDLQLTVRPNPAQSAAPADTAAQVRTSAPGAATQTIAARPLSGLTAQQIATAPRGEVDAQLRNATSFQVRVVSTTPPSNAPAATTGSTAPAASATPTAAPTAQAAATFSAGNAAATGTLATIAATPNQVAATATGANANAATAADPAQITGRVVGHAGNGQPIISTARGLVALQTSQLPIGTQVTLAIQAAPSVQAQASPAAQLGATLEQAIAAVSTVHPEMAAAANAAIPRPGPRMAAATMFLLTALKGGRVDSVLGEGGAAALGKAGQAGLLDRLRDNGAKLSQRLPDVDGAAAHNGDWRSVVVPIMTGDGWQSLDYSWHENAGGEDADGDEEVARFRVETRFTRLGPFRLDGFVQARRLDLIVRHGNALPARSEPELMELFSAAMEAMDFRGTLTFERRPDLRLGAGRAAVDQHVEVSA